VRLDAVELSDWNPDEYGPQIGYVPQEIEFFEGTVAENIARLGAIDPEKVVQATKLIGMHEIILSFPKGYDTELGETGYALSGGQRQRVAMGRAIVREPQVFLMDEPLSNLDAKLRVQTRNQIASLQRRLGVTTVYVTHDQVEAMTMGDRVAVMKDGVLQQVATPRELYEAPKNVFVAGFIGSPAMNLVKVPIVDGGVKFGNKVVAISSNIVSKATAKQVTLGFRPENTEVSKTKGVSVEIDVVEELGSDAYIYGRAKLDDGEIELVARVDGRDHPNKGETVSLNPKGGIMHIFDIETGERLIG
jgi:multiple sugar transport system ATP-binding protein